MAREQWKVTEYNDIPSAFKALFERLNPSAGIDVIVHELEDGGIRYRFIPVNGNGAVKIKAVSELQAISKPETSKPKAANPKAAKAAKPKAAKPKPEISEPEADQPICDAEAGGGWKRELRERQKKHAEADSGDKTGDMDDLPYYDQLDSQAVQEPAESGYPSFVE